ncbi:MAG: hypothetical protein AB7I34_11320 [Rhizobiaceae bacterium]
MTKIKKAVASSAEITAALDAARTTATEADAAVATAKKNYEAALLTEAPAALRALLDEQVDQKIVADQARARAAKLEADLEKALAAEAEDGRAKRYAEAKALADTAREKLWQQYPRAAGEIRDILRAIAEADIAVAAVNNDLPAGAERLEKPEAGRSSPNEWKEELERDRIVLWAGEGNPSSPLQEALQGKVALSEHRRRGGPVEGYLKYDDGGGLKCVRGLFERVKFLPDRSGWTADSLANAISLPGLEAGDSDFWEPTSGGATFVLRELEKPVRKRPEPKPREPEYSYSPIWK